MRLNAVRRHWERLGRHDPLWAVLTDPNKREGRWDPEPFFESGVVEIEGQLRRAQDMGIAVPRDRALDFGCGVGRLTQAMARQFDRCDGVDISAPMLELADQYNQAPARCTYHRNTEPTLALFEDGIFTFVYSTLVLQHMEPTLAKGYVREMYRVLAPGGLLVFQAPSHRTAHEPPTGAGRTRSKGRVPAAACRGRLSATPASLSIEADQWATLAVTVENLSPHVWPSLPDALGIRQINLANHWLSASGEMVRRDDGRCPLPHDLGPGEQTTLMFGFQAPSVGGDYLVELDIVQENGCWFAEFGFETIRVPCRVTGGVSAPVPVQALPAPEAASEPLQPAEAPSKPFRERHPVAYRVLRASGMRPLSRVGRRSMVLLREGRDHAIRRIAHPIIRWIVHPFIQRIVHPIIQQGFQPLVRGTVHPFVRWTWHPLVNWWRQRPFAPKMEMHCIARTDVLDILSREGATVVTIDEELVPGGFQSCRYWVRKEQR